MVDSIRLYRELNAVVSGAVSHVAVAIFLAVHIGNCILPITRATNVSPPEREMQVQDFAGNVHKVLVKLQGVADEFWQLIEGYSLPSVVRVEEINDPIEAFKQLRSVHATSLNICNALRSFKEPFDIKADAFIRKIEHFKFVINRSARTCGLSCLPDELLVDILDRAAGSFKPSVRLSHVCKRFRRVLLWSSKHWTGLILTSKMPPSMILGMVERCNVGPFSARIEFDRKVGPSSDSIKAIIDLGERLDDLTIGPFWADDIAPGHCHLPSLRTFSVLPHPSLSSSLVSFTLRVWAPIKPLLEFLLSAKKLEVLGVCSSITDLDDADSLEPISLPNLTTLRFGAEEEEYIEGFHQLMEKIVTFNVSSLDVVYENPDIGPIVDLIHAKQSIRDLRLELWNGNYSPLPSIPRYIETLELSGWHVASTVDMWLRNPGSFPAQNLRMLKFSDRDVASHVILCLRDYFVKSGCDMVRFQSVECSGMDDGTFDLDDVHKAVCA